MFWRDHWIHGDVIAEFVDPDDPDDDPQLVSDCHWADIATEEVEIKGARCFAEAVCSQVGFGGVQLLSAEPNREQGKLHFELSIIVRDDRSPANDVK